MKPIVITNTAYGPTYTNLLLTQCLKSLLDKTNIPAFSDSIEFVIFTDEESKPLITKHDNFYTLLETLKGNVRFEKLVWTEKLSTDDARYGKRYSRLAETLSRSINIAYQTGAFCMPLCADHVVAQKFLPTVLSHIDNGNCDSVFVQPIRAAAESMIPVLDTFHRAYPAQPLCQLSHQNLHPLWVSSHWEATQFTKGPYVMIWGSENGLLVRSFPVTPIIFEPNKEMLSMDGVIDLNLPLFCKTPYWASDWDTCPIINIDPLSCHYPPFMSHMSSIGYVKSWARHHIDERLFNNLKTKFYYPNRFLVDLHPEMLEQSDQVVEAIIT